MEGQLLTLQEAADRLKVHYMTAYRWVRKGDLPAFKAGGRLRVRGVDLDRFVLDRQVDVARPSHEPGRTDWPVHVQRLHEVLRDGRGVDASSLVRKVVADGASAGDVYIQLLAPALHRLGDDWAAGEITVAEEHRATEIVHGLMARLGEHFRRRGASRGTAVTLTPPEELHALASAMTADFLRAAGYEVHHLGANVPVEDLRTFLHAVPSDLVCVSATRVDTDPEVLSALVKAARDNGGPAVVVGGQGAEPDVVDGVGAIHIGDLAELTARVSQLTGAP